MRREARDLVRNFLNARTVKKETIWEKSVIPNISKTINTIEEDKSGGRQTGHSGSFWWKHQADRLEGIRERTKDAGSEGRNPEPG
ncbi:hypothetical protein CFIMG_006691RA [Ceratocystis fimbriata CBS 114723]|uniref:Uncharacterized protein n=1 Tax=Ceratocystis fimbriata CBS 114723 TaxID=1035309 RepID=A0A2C5WU15_9PEZI|nr:hypothetical protein CFIMG_006691RA [Ceratocystis fimbriata CBS 114723]